MARNYKHIGWVSDVQSSIFCVAPNEVAAGVAIHGYGMFDAHDNGFSEGVGKSFSLAL